MGLSNVITSDMSNDAGMMDTLGKIAYPFDPPISFNTILAEYEDGEWTQGISKEMIEKMIVCAEFIQKADWEGGFDTVARDWPDMVPHQLRWASSAFVRAMDTWENEVRWYMEHCGVAY